MNTESDKKSGKTLIVVLGMHRSGTSVIARAMQALGGELGERLMPPVAGVNDKGFFEDVDVHAINEELLRAAGLDWYALTPISLDCIDPALLDRLRTRATIVLREKCADSQVFVLKDPRLTRLVPFWRPIFASLNMQVIYVVAVRNPISVTRSLTKVHHFAEEKSYILWLTHVIAALEDTRNEKRVFVDYDLLMDASMHELSRVSEVASLPLNALAVEEFEKEFLETGLRNTRFSVSDLDAVGSASPQVKNVFSAMQRAAAARIDAYDPELDIAAAEGKRYLDSIAPLLRYEWLLVEHIEKVMPALNDAHAKIQTLEATLRAVEEHGANLLNASDARAAVEIAARDQVVIALQQAATESLHATQEATDLLKASQRHERNVTELNERLSAANATLNAQCEAFESKAAAQELSLERTKADLAQVLASTSWRITAPLRMFVRAVSSRSR